MPLNSGGGARGVSAFRLMIGDLLDALQGGTCLLYFIPKSDEAEQRYKGLGRVEAKRHELPRGELTVNDQQSPVSEREPHTQEPDGRSARLQQLPQPLRAIVALQSFEVLTRPARVQ